MLSFKPSQRKPKKKHRDVTAHRARLLALAYENKRRDDPFPPAAKPAPPHGPTFRVLRVKTLTTPRFIAVLSSKSTRFFHPFVNPLHNYSCYSTLLWEALFSRSQCVKTLALTCHRRIIWDVHVYFFYDCPTRALKVDWHHKVCNKKITTWEMKSSWEMNSVVIARKLKLIFKRL